MWPMTTNIAAKKRNESRPGKWAFLGGASRVIAPLTRGQRGRSKSIWARQDEQVAGRGQEQILGLPAARHAPHQSPCRRARSGRYGQRRVETESAVGEQVLKLPS